jgi:hypothetical protein
VPTLFPIEIKSNGSKVFDWSTIEYDVTPFVCLKANVIQGDVLVETKAEKYFFSQAAPTPQFVYNLDLVANFEPYREVGFDAGTWDWYVEPEPLDCTAEGNEEDWAYTMDWSDTAKGSFTIGCGQLPFKATATVTWSDI